MTVGGRWMLALHNSATCGKVIARRRANIKRGRRRWSGQACAHRFTKFSSNVVKQSYLSYFCANDWNGSDILSVCFNLFNLNKLEWKYGRQRLLFRPMSTCPFWCKNKNTSAPARCRVKQEFSPQFLYLFW